MQEISKDKLSNNHTEDDSTHVDESYMDLIPPDKKAVIYARKSIKTDSHSIASQIDRGKEVLYEKGLILYKVYHDSESASKYTYDKRPGFSELMKDLKSGKFKNIVVLKRDRLSRQFDELLQIKEKFAEYDIKLHYSAPGEYQPSDDDIYSSFIENLIMAIGEYEARIVKERTDTGKKIQREKGIYSPGKDNPFGFTNEVIQEADLDYKLIPHEYESKIVEGIFKEYLRKSYEIDQIITFARSSFSHEFKNTKKSLNRNKIQYMFTNPTYCAIQRPPKNLELFYKDKATGKYRINKENIKPLTNIKPIIKQSLWFRVALKYLNNKRQYSGRIKNYLFKNLLACSHCGSNVGISQNYYQCNKNNCFRIKKDIVIDALIKKILADLYNEKDATELINQKISKCIDSKKTLEKNLLQITKAKHTLLFNFINDYNNGSIKEEIKELIHNEKKKLEEIGCIDDKILSLKNIHVPIASLRSFETIDNIIHFMKTSSNVNKTQELLTNIIEKVYISGTTTKCEIQNIDYGSK